MEPPGIKPINSLHHLPTEQPLPWLLPCLLSSLSVSSSIGPLREVQLELILLHVVLPTLLEHSNTKAAMLKVVQVWIRVAARLL